MDGGRKANCIALAKRFKAEYSIRPFIFRCFGYFFRSAGIAVASAIAPLCTFALFIVCLYQSNIFFFLSLRHLTWLLHWTHSQNELIFFEASVREKSRKNTRYKIYAKAFAVSDLRNRLSNREIKAKRKIYSAAKRNIRCPYVCVDMCSFILLNYSSSCKYT